MLGAEERRLRRMDRYAASCPGESRGGASEGNAADDALMVNQGRTFAGPFALTWGRGNFII